MLVEQAPGVTFQWIDEGRYAVAAVRTDVAGFIGIAERGPLHQPVAVESWTQFVSTFGGHLAQGYLAYAVEGFFANGGRTCWVVRAADPATAQAAVLELEDLDGRPRLRLEASSPGIWAHDVSVASAPTTGDRFSLTLRRPDGEQEFWPNLTTAVASLDLLDRAGRPTLRLSAYHPKIWRYRVSVELAVHGTAAKPRFSLELDLEVRSWDDVTTEEGDIFSPLGPSDDDFDPQKRTFADLSMSPRDPRYAPTVLGQVPLAEQLVAASDLFSPSSFPANTPALEAANLRFGRGWLESEPRYAQRVLNHPLRGSRLVRAERSPAPPALAESISLTQQTSLAESHQPRLTGLGWLAGGADGLATLEPRHVSGLDAPPEERWGLAALESVDQVAIVALPDAMPKEGFATTRQPAALRCHALAAPPDAPPAGAVTFAPHFDELQILRLQTALIDHCERMKDRVALLDPLPYQVTPQQVIAWRGSFDTSFAAFYYPWLEVRDPLRLSGLLRRVPPSGHIAGILARSDLLHGVHKPPANEVVEAARDLTVAVGEIGHGDLNAAQINLVRAYSGRGLRLMGARTLASDSELRYLNVRRLLTMIVEALDEGLQWTVLEPNGPRLWKTVEREVTSFLDRLWRAGQLDGGSPEEAYFARCDATTNPPEETEVGRLICQLGVLPPWPAEFVVVRLGRSEGALDILQVTGGRDG